MTAAERAKPDLIKASRKRRIAAGAGVQVQEVNRMLAQFEQMQGMMKKMQKGGMAKLMRSFGGMGGMGKAGMPGGMGGGMPMPPSGGFGKRGR
jgi:signal recognition particle subunit SRP54